MKLGQCDSEGGSFFIRSELISLLLKASKILTVLTRSFDCHFQFSTASVPGVHLDITDLFDPQT